MYYIDSEVIEILRYRQKNLTTLYNRIAFLASVIKAPKLFADYYEISLLPLIANM